MCYSMFSCNKQNLNRNADYKIDVKWDNYPRDETMIHNALSLTSRFLLRWNYAIRLLGYVASVRLWVVNSSRYLMRGWIITNRSQRVTAFSLDTCHDGVSRDNNPTICGMYTDRFESRCVNDNRPAFRKQRVVCRKQKISRPRSRANSMKYMLCYKVNVRQIFCSISHIQILINERCKIIIFRCSESIIARVLYKAAYYAALSR